MVATILLVLTLILTKTYSGIFSKQMFCSFLDNKLKLIKC